jgi:pilus assembly protein CpaF
MAEATLNGTENGAGDAQPAAVTPAANETPEERLRAAVTAAFDGEKVLNLPRPELALRIGQIVSQDLETSGSSLNLLERRKLVSDLIEWVVTQAREKAEAEQANGVAQRPSGELDEILDRGVSPRKTTSVRSLSSDMALAKKRIHPLVMDRLDIAAASQLPRDELQHQIAEIVSEVARDEKLHLNLQEQSAIVEVMLDDMLGLGPLEPLLADDLVTDIMVNGPNQVYIEKGGKLEVTDVKFQNDEHVLNISRRIVSQVGRRIDESHPLVDARLMDGSRVNIIIPPLAIDGPTISIRKFAKQGITLDVMQRQSNVSPAMATVLKIAGRSALNILISGGTGSGKTTLLNAMSQTIDTGERIVTIEDAAELQLQQPHVVRLETRPANLEGQGEITMRDLVKNALRMRPDRIILGEVRGSEAVDMLQAMNTGHDGSLGTIHANRPREALTRLENMVGMAGINLPAKAVRTQIASALDMIVQVSRMRDGMRRITHIEEVVGMEGDIITTQTLFTFEFEGEDTSGNIQGRFKPSGLRPHFTPKAAYYGLERPLLEALE